MKYMFLIYTPQEDMDTSDGHEDEIAEHLELARGALRRGAYVHCDALGSVATATTVRVRDREVETFDGPFMETKEVLGGFYILDCKDLDEAIDYASRIPPARIGSIEVRPIMTIPGWDEAMAETARELGVTVAPTGA
jgi:hypothetical protein